MQFHKEILFLWILIEKINLLLYNRMRLTIFNNNTRRTQSEYFEGQKLIDFDDILRLYDTNTDLLNIDESDFGFRKTPEGLGLIVDDRDITYFDLKIPNNKPDMEIIERDRLEEKINYYNISLFGRYSKDVLDEIEKRLRAAYSHKYILIIDFENVRTTPKTTAFIKRTLEPVIFLDYVTLDIKVKGDQIHCFLVV